MGTILMNPQPRKRNRGGSSQYDYQADTDSSAMGQPGTTSAGMSQSDTAGMSAGTESSFGSAGTGDIGGMSSTASPATALPDAAMETVRVVTDAVTSQVKSLASNVAQEVGASAEAGVAKGADAMQGFARAIESAASELESQSPQIASRVRTVANRVDGLSNNIRGRSLNELLTAAQDLAKSQPTAFIAGAVVAGFALARFIKSSAANQQPAQQPGESYSSSPQPYSEGSQQLGAGSQPFEPGMGP
jgi:hypothetical protein